MKKLLFLLFLLPYYFGISQNYILPFAVYDFDVGDEFHYLWNYQGGGKKIKQTVISKQVFSFGAWVEYKFQVSLANYNSSTYTTTYSTYRDSIQYRFIRDTIQDTIPLCNSISHPYVDTLFSDTTLGIFQCFLRDTFGFNPDFGPTYTFIQRPQYNFIKTTSYSKGLGVILEKDDDYDPFGTSYSKKLVYYKKYNSGIIGGNPWGFNVGINELSKLDFKIYPNPANDFIKIDTDNLNSEIKYQLTNSFGQILLSGVNRTIIDVSSIPAGIYFLKITNEKGDSGIKRVVISK